MRCGRNWGTGVRARYNSALFRCAIALTTYLGSVLICGSSVAQINVNLSVNASAVRANMPDGGIAMHTSVYANQFTNSNLDNRLQEANVEMLRYPGGSYSDLFHWTVPPQAPYYQNCCSTLPDVTKPHPLTP